MIDLQALKREFREEYGREPRLFRAPGRVNLIGEHTDYNDGFVMPMAIDYGTIVAAAARDDRRVRVRSLNRGESFEFALDGESERQRHIWLDYVEGVARVLESRGALLSGADLLIESDVPVGAGLSSSAALEISVGLAMLTLSGVEVDRVALALAGQRAEHEYVGTMCGIMDQLVVTLGQKSHALLIDCRSLETQAIPLQTDDVAIVICDSRVKHELASSQYNVRRAECERAVQLLHEVLPGVRALRDVSVEEFEKYKERLPEPVRSRCRHVVTEDARTLRAADALRSGDFQEMGRLMLLSHESLRDDYEVSCFELDKLVEVAMSLGDATLGARMTGGGFGGCTVNLVRRGALEKFQEVVAREYNKATQKQPGIYVVSAAEGAKEQE